MDDFDSYDFMPGGLGTLTATPYVDSYDNWDYLKGGVGAQNNYTNGYDNWDYLKGGIGANALTAAGTPTNDTLAKLKAALGSGFNAVVNAFKKPNSNETDWARVLGAAGGAYGAYQSFNNKPPVTGYQGSIPSLVAVKDTVQGTYDPNRRPGSSGQRYFTDTRFVAPDKVSEARTQAAQDAQGLAAYNRQNPNVQPAPQAPLPNANISQQYQPAASSVINRLPVPQYAQGGHVTDVSRYLSGDTDGMADMVDTSIDDKHPAKLSHGEYVIPADVVSHLGNGNSQAGASELDRMLAQIRAARTGNPQQGRQINPQDFLPT